MEAEIANYNREEHCNYRLECVFDDGTVKVADITPYLSKDAFKPLAGHNIFSSARQNSGYFIEWKDYHIDLSADTLWHIAKSV